MAFMRATVHPPAPGLTQQRPQARTGGHAGGAQVAPAQRKHRWGDSSQPGPQRRAASVEPGPPIQDIARRIGERAPQGVIIGIVRRHPAGAQGQQAVALGGG
jgi:hypothetical protein